MLGLCWTVPRSTPIRRQEQLRTKFLGPRPRYVQRPKWRLTCIATFNFHVEASVHYPTSVRMFQYYSIFNQLSTAGYVEEKIKVFICTILFD